MKLITPLMFCWKDFQRSILSYNDENFAERSGIAANIYSTTSRKQTWHQ
ncbi:MAG: hypothetical protein ACTS73_01735 [Arsenophonus sp. NEOnobi-MAG3]